MPIFLSEVPLLFRRKVLSLDVALIQVSRPDTHGFCTLGPSVDTTRAAIQNAKFIIGKLARAAFALALPFMCVHRSHLSSAIHMCCNSDACSLYSFSLYGPVSLIFLFFLSQVLVGSIFSMV